LTAIEKAMADSPPPPDALSVMVEGEVESLASQVADALWWSRKELAGRQSVLREQTLRFAVGGVALEGRLDRVDRLADGSLEVIDFKTGAFSHPLKVGPDNLQMALYRLAIRDRGEPVAVRVMGLNARRRFASYAVGPEAEWPDPEPIVQTMGQWIAEGKFWPIPHGRPEPCRTCTYRIICPAEVGEEARDRAEHLPEVALWRQADAGREDE
ncbi:MAG: PD-(D/E)XK nuclease family protein, partial [Firmicutes bacterium]|nr:PD-(D/E)XK nuclease family protein [Bacillota bacterium]